MNPTLKEIVIKAVTDVLVRHQGNVTRTARELDISIRTVQRYISRDRNLLSTVMRLRDSTICPCCKRESSTVAKRQRLSNYEDESLNVLLSCLECHRRDTEQLQEQWDDYNRGRL